jgi:hypothetical protein
MQLDEICIAMEENDQPLGIALHRVYREFRVDKNLVKSEVYLNRSTLRMSKPELDGRSSKKARFAKSHA